jgi:hypothetical protein
MSAYGMLGGCDCCSPTCNPTCAQVYIVNAVGADGCESGTFGADCLAGLQSSLDGGPTGGWSIVSCGEAYACANYCEGSDCNTQVTVACDNNTDFTSGLAEGLSYVQTTISPGFWSKTGCLFTGPCAAFCVEWVADGVTSYATYGPIASGATLYIEPIAGDNVSCSLSHCGACDPD